MWKKRVACLMAMLALCGTMVVSAADYTLLEKTEKVETTVYGTPQTGSLNDRIAGLDKMLHGQATVTGSLQDQINKLYTDVYGSTGSDLSLLAAVNLMEWQYSGQITEDSLVSRVGSLEEGINGKTTTPGNIVSRVSSLRHAMLGNKKYVSQSVTIPAGTIIPMHNLDELSSKVVTEGETVRFAVADDVKVDDVIAIPKGMETDAVITNARKAGRFGRDGKIEITYDTVRASDGTPVSLTVGEKTKEEYKRTAGAVGASAAGAVILGPVGLVGGLFVNGKDVDFPAGTEMYAETSEDTNVVGFKENGTTDASMKTANMAASGVNVPATEAAYHNNPPAEETQAGGNVTPVDLSHEGDSTAEETTTVTITSDDSDTTGDDQ